MTAFEPFGGDTVNPTIAALEALRSTVDGGELPGVGLTGRVLPVEFERAQQQISELITETDPHAVICLGLAGGRTRVNPERLAVNLMDARIPDNAGTQPTDEPVVPDGPAAYFSTLPVKAMVDALTEAQVPAEVSMTAGTYVCNTVLYRVLHSLACTSTHTGAIPAGFIHVPHPDVMDQETINRAVQVCVRTVTDQLS